MDNHQIIEEEPFIQLSSVYNPMDIISLGDLNEHNSPSLKNICLRYIKNYICKQKCIVCSLISLDLPQTLEQEILNLVPLNMELVSSIYEQFPCYYFVES